MKKKTQIILVSGQMLPNVLTVSTPAERPEKIILCTSSKMKRNAGYLEDFYRRYQIACEQFDIGDALDYRALLDRFLDLRAKLDEKIGDVSLNITGGTKLMTLAAMASFYNTEDKIPIFYVQPERNSYIMLNSDDSEEHQLAAKLKIEDFFRVHGYMVKSICRSQSPENIIDFGNELLSRYDYFRDAVSSLNYYAAEAEKSGKLEYVIPAYEKSDEAIDELGQLCYQNDLVSYYDDRKIVFKDAESRRICGGTWLEYMVYHKLCEIPLQDRAMSIEIVSSNGTKNELDGAFLFNNTLYIIECKTSRIDRQENSMGVLYKLDSLKGIPGIFTKPLLISFLPLEPFEKKRAEEQHISCIFGKNISNLESHLKKYFPMKE